MVVITEGADFEVIILTRFANEYIVPDSKRKAFTHLILIAFQWHLENGIVVGPELGGWCVLARMVHLEQSDAGIRFRRILYRRQLQLI